MRWCASAAMKGWMTEKKTNWRMLNCGKVDHGFPDRVLAGVLRRPDMEYLVYPFERPAKRRRIKEVSVQVVHSALL